MINSIMLQYSIRQNKAYSLLFSEQCKQVVSSEITKSTTFKIPLPFVLTFLLFMFLVGFCSQPVTITVFLHSVSLWFSPGMDPLT